MQAIELRAQIDQEQRIVVTLPPGTPSGQVRVLVLLPDAGAEDDAEAAWAPGLAQEWTADWSDPREDIYTLSDGEPAHETR